MIENPPTSWLTVISIESLDDKFSFWIIYNQGAVKSCIISALYKQGL